jgi:hypothetical protein
MVHSEHSRGTTNFAYQVCGTLGVMFFDKVGGALDAKRDTAPFSIVFIGEALLVILFVTLGFITKSLKY